VAAQRIQLGRPDNSSIPESLNPSIYLICVHQFLSASH
jgi:hypothetical protein